MTESASNLNPMADPYGLHPETRLKGLLSGSANLDSFALLAASLSIDEDVLDQRMDDLAALHGVHRSVLIFQALQIGLQQLERDALTPPPIVRLNDWPRSDG